MTEKISQTKKIKNNSIKSLAWKLKLFLKEIFKRFFFKSRIIFGLFAANMATNSLIWGVLLLFVNRLDGQVILHYNVYFGVDKVGSRKEAFIIPIVGLAIFLVNFLLSLILYKSKERIAGYVLLLVSLMVQICLIVAAASVALINY